MLYPKKYLDHYKIGVIVITNQMRMNLKQYIIGSLIIFFCSFHLKTKLISIYSKAQLFIILSNFKTFNLKSALKNKKKLNFYFWIFVLVIITQLKDQF